MENNGLNEMQGITQEEKQPEREYIKELNSLHVVSDELLLSQKMAEEAEKQPNEPPKYFM